MNGLKPAHPTDEAKHGAASSASSQPAVDAPKVISEATTLAPPGFEPTVEADTDGDLPGVGAIAEPADTNSKGEQAERPSSVVGLGSLGPAPYPLIPSNGLNGRAHLAVTASSMPETVPAESAPDFSGHPEPVGAMNGEMPDIPMGGAPCAFSHV